MNETATKITGSLEELQQQAVRLHQQDKLEEAAALYRTCLALSPDHATIWSNYGSLLRKQHKLPASIGALRRAMELDPAPASIRSNLANALSDIGEFIQAVELKRQLVAEHPDEIEHIRTLAAAMRGCWLNQEAIDLIDQAEARLGTEDNLILQRALAHLMLGNYRQGFADFESRFGGTEIALPKDLPWPRWAGEPLDGKRIIVLPEQGFGDAILASRFLPALKALGPRIYMVVKKPLRRLAGRLEGLDEIRAKVVKEDTFDYYTPIMSLPHFTGLADGDVPSLPRLMIPDDSRARARKITDPFRNRFRIGVVWTGSSTYLANHRRSTRPESFLDIARIPGVQLFSLYKGDNHSSFVESGMAGLIADSCGTDRDFADTAAVIDEMDLMITTDTAVVHIAASLGKPVWNLLAHEGFWLYGDGETTPWYPSMRLFRQRSNGDWEELFHRVETELRRLLEERSP